MKDALETKSIFLRVPKPVKLWLESQIPKTAGASNVQDVIRVLLDRERLKQ